MLTRRKPASVRPGPGSIQLEGDSVPPAAARHYGQRSEHYRSMEIRIIAGLLAALGIAIGMLFQASQFSEVRAEVRLLETEVMDLQWSIERLSRSQITSQARLAELEALADPTDDEADQ